MNFKVAKPNFIITCFSKKNICVVCKMLGARGGGGTSI